jgi:signal transduction histidine kinase
MIPLKVLSENDEEAAVTRFADNRLFNGISPEILLEIGAGIEGIRYNAGEIIFREGDVGDCMFLVGEGRVKVSKAGRGNQQETLGFIESGSFFGEMALLDCEPRSAQAAAVEPTLLGRVDEAAFQSILHFAPSSLHINFLRCVTARLRHVNTHFITEVMRSERLSLVGSMANSIIHDLKNPISIILCCAELMEKSEDPCCREYTPIIKRSLEGMMEMTQELLDFARGNTSLQFAEVPLYCVLQELDSRLPQVNPERIHFIREIRGNPTIKVDIGRFVRVLLNLIKNSIEALREPGMVRLSAELADGLLCVSVSDTGCGIPPELLPRIFEPFVTSGKANGTGLGMAIAKAVVEAHGGEILARSKVGCGTTIQIRLPIVSA